MWPPLAAFCTSAHGWCLPQKCMHIMLFPPSAFQKGPQDTGPIPSSFFSHSICLNGSGCGEQIFSTVLCVRRPYPAKLEAGWWLGSLTNSWEPAVFYIWRDTWNLSSAFFFHDWLFSILLTHPLQNKHKPFKSAVGKPSGPHREHRVNTTVARELTEET